MTNKKHKLLYIRLKNNIRTRKSLTVQTYKFSNEVLKDDPAIVENEQRVAHNKAEKYWRLPLKLRSIQMGTMDMDFARNLTTVNFVYEYIRN